LADGINTAGAEMDCLEVWKMSRKWELREGKVTVVEDADTASLVIVARDLKNREDKIAVLEEVLQKMRK